MMVWGCISAHGMGDLHICEGTINAEQYMQVSEQHILWSNMVFLREGLAYFSKTMPNHIPHILQKHGSILKESGC